MDDEVLNFLILLSIRRNFRKLGIEGCLEAIEKLPNPVHRAKLRQAHLEYLKNNLKQRRK